VINFAQHYGIPCTLKNVIEDTDAYAEMLSIGGKSQVPFFVDGNTHMYESADIINYLDEHYVDKN
tara:strand:- start:27744 stop:27938 length:195 start_codon:yes stop_codon:yes gene_type:complete